MEEMSPVPPPGGGHHLHLVHQGLPGQQPYAPAVPRGDAVRTELLVRVGRGDEAAFAALYDEVADEVYGVAKRIVRDAHLSEEVTQEVLVEVWRRSPRFDPALGTATGWILMIARARAVDRVRSEQAHRDRHAAHERRAAHVDHAPDERVERRLDRERVRQALAQLTDLQRSAVELAFYGGHTHTEVAQLLDIPLGTAKTRIRDGLIRLRDALGVGE
jgi:RNA polymerase sigma-70 factor (ECF subfamily)